MKIEIDIPDLAEIYFSDRDYDELTGEDIKKLITELALDHYVDNLYDDTQHEIEYGRISQQVLNMIGKHKDEIIQRVVDKVAGDIARRKAIVEQMPKKSEIANIDKEWEKYFMELIDKAIAKRFK